MMLHQRPSQMRTVIMADQNRMIDYKLSGSGLPASRAWALGRIH